MLYTTDVPDTIKFEDLYEEYGEPSLYAAMVNDADRVNAFVDTYGLTYALCVVGTVRNTLTRLHKQSMSDGTIRSITDEGYVYSTAEVMTVCGELLLFGLVPAIAARMTEEEIKACVFHVPDDLHSSIPFTDNGKAQAKYAYEMMRQIGKPVLDKGEVKK